MNAVDTKIDATSQPNPEPKISVIIPVYNEEVYLTECLESVAGQSLRDIEIICVDDGSTDGSPDILRRWALRDNRIKIIRQANQGAGGAQNTGIKAAMGQFICFLGADDYYYDSGALEALYQAAIQNNALVCGGGSLGLRDGVVGELSKPKGKDTFSSEGFIKFADFLYAWMYVRYIFNRKLIVDNNIYFPNYRRGQDPVWCAHALDAAVQFYALPRIIYIYRLGVRNIDWTPSLRTDVLQYCTDLMRFAIDRNYLPLFDFMENELFSLTGRFKQEKMVQGSKEYWQQIIRHRFYKIMSSVTRGPAKLKYRRKSEEARSLLSRAQEAEGR